MKKETTSGVKRSSAFKLAILGASLAGAAVGVYALLGPKGKKHQKQAQEWAIKMKADVVKKLAAARNVSEPVYSEIIDSVARVYENGKKANHDEILTLTRDLKKHWRILSASAQAIKRDVVKNTKRVVRKVGR